MDFSTWITFFAACWAISLSPGPGAVASMSAGMGHGFWRGYAIVIGLVSNDGESTWVEGAALMAVYAIVAAAALLWPVAGMA